MRLPPISQRLSPLSAAPPAPRRPSLLRRLGAIADRPGDSEEEQLRHMVLILGGVLMSGGGLLWGTLAVVFGLPMEALIPFSYTALTAVNLFVLARTKHFASARVVQIAASLTLPFAFMWVLGGFRSSGVMMIWSLMALIGSLSFARLTYFSWVFFLFVGLTILSGVLESSLTTPAILAGRDTGSVFFVLNMVVVNGAVFLLIVFFQLGRQKALAEVARKDEELAISRSIIQREKMAALGQLVAGIAHELNTPLGAIRASVFNLENATRQIVSGLPELLSAVTPEQLAGLFRLLAAAKAGAPLTSREERQLRRELTAGLAAKGLDDAARVADVLVEVGVRGDADDHYATVAGPSGARILAAANDLTSLQRNGSNIRVAADRAAKIVFALKSYAHPGAREGELEDGAVADNLETVVTLYMNQFKHGIELVRSYRDKGEIKARHDELNQVWTNLLHNALQALGSRGKIELRVDADLSSVRVAIEDNGPGIAPEVMQRLFEPFFTTKAKGEGTGLGLSICRKIVDEHGGTIDVESAPGRTVFTVTLPRQAPSPTTKEGP